MVYSAHAEWEALSSITDLVKIQSTNRAEFLAEAKSGAFDGVVAAYRAFDAADITGRFDAEIAAAMPSSFKFLCQAGAGYDPIDVEACTEHGIRVTNVPEIADDATANTALFLMLGALRAFNPCLFALREGHFKGKTAPKRGSDPRGKTLGILGLGGIGRSLAKKVLPLGMTIQYHNRNPLPAELSVDAKYVSFDQLLATSDVLAILLPLNVSILEQDDVMLRKEIGLISQKSTHHIISAKEFDKMKDGIVIINAARGALIDEAALVQALDSGKVLSCGLDVFEEEPIVHPGLLSNPNTILLPHCGTMTIDTAKAMEVFTIENVRSAVTTGTVKGIVPEQVHMGW